MNEFRYVIRRDLLFGKVPIYTVPVYSTLSFECLVEDPEVVFSDGKIIDNFVIERFMYSNVGRYECRKKLFDTVSVKVDIILPGANFIYIVKLVLEFQKLCHCTIIFVYDILWLFW